jgi:hypothetical protein
MERIRISKEREIITYSQLWRASGVFLDHAKAEPNGSSYPALASLTFSAFALEAFLNHIGERLFETWRDIEPLSPRAKVNVLCERIGLTPDWGTQPWQVVPEIIAFRNKVAHGKNEILRVEKEVPQDEKYNQIFNEFLFADWQSYATADKAERVRDRLLALFKMIHTGANLENDWLLRDGTQITSTHPVRE